MKNLLLLILTFFISISLSAQIEIHQASKYKFQPRSSFLHSLNNNVNTTFSKQRNELGKNDSTKIETVSNSNPNETLLKSNKNFRKHKFGVGASFFFSDILLYSDIAYFSITHKYLFNKKSNAKLLFLQSAYNSVYNYEQTTKTSQMFSLEVGYEIRSYGDFLDDSFFNLFFTSGLANITIIANGTIYHKEEDKINTQNTINSTFIKHSIGCGGGGKLSLEMGYMFLYNFKKRAFNENMFGFYINVNFCLNRI